MATTYDSSNVAVGEGVSTLSVSLTIASNSNRVLLAHVGVTDGTPPTFTSVKWNTSETLTSESQITPGNRRIGLFRLFAPTAGSFTVDLVLSAGPADVHLGAISLYNATQSALGTPATDINTTEATQSITCDSETDALAVAFCFGGDVSSSNPTIVLDDGTFRYESEATPFSCCGCATEAGAATNTMAWTFTGTMFSSGAIAVSVPPAVVAAVGVYVPYPDAWMSGAWMEGPWMAGKSDSRSFLYKPRRVYVEVP